MAEYQIRAARPDDLEAVYQVFNLAHILHRQAHPEIFQEAAYPDDVKDYLMIAIRAMDARVFVTELHGEIIGAVLAWVRHTPDNPVLIQRTYVTVDNLVVSEAFRQQGVGQAMMERVHKWAQERGLREIQLTVWDFNEGAQAFYKKLDYEMLHHHLRKKLP